MSNLGNKLAQAFSEGLHISSNTMTRIKRRFSLSSSRVKNLWFSDGKTSSPSRSFRGGARGGGLYASGGTKRKSTGDQPNEHDTNNPHKIRRQARPNDDLEFNPEFTPTAPASKLRKTNKDTSVTLSIPQCDFDDDKFQQPFKLKVHLDQPPVTREEQKVNAWNNDDKSLNILIVENTDSTVFRRYPVAQSTDCIRGKAGFTSGLHIWEIKWPTNQRGTHAVIGVATKDAPLHCSGYKSLIGNNGSSWGWDIGRSKLMHDYANNPPKCYPDVLSSDEVFVVPERVKVILDMDAGTLAFMVEDQYLGVAFSGLKGQCLYPIVSAVWGHCEIEMTYLCKPHDMSLKSLSRYHLRQHLTCPPPPCFSTCSTVVFAAANNNITTSHYSKCSFLSPYSPSSSSSTSPTSPNLACCSSQCSGSSGGGSNSSGYLPTKLITPDLTQKLHIPKCLQAYLL
jgi:hypothetical protein